MRFQQDWSGGVKDPHYPMLEYQPYRPWEDAISEKHFRDKWRTSRDEVDRLIDLRRRRRVGSVRDEARRSDELRRQAAAARARASSSSKTAEILARSAALTRAHNRRVSEQNRQRRLSPYEREREAAHQVRDRMTRRMQARRAQLQERQRLARLQQAQERRQQVAAASKPKYVRSILHEVSPSGPGLGPRPVAQDLLPRVAIQAKQYRFPTGQALTSQGALLQMRQSVPIQVSHTF
jgi:hypothetical protein